MLVPSYNLFNVKCERSNFTSLNFWNLWPQKRHLLDFSYMFYFMPTTGLL